MSLLYSYYIIIIIPPTKSIYLAIYSATVLGIKYKKCLTQPPKHQNQKKPRNLND